MLTFCLCVAYSHIIFGVNIGQTSATLAAPLSADIDFALAKLSQANTRQVGNFSQVTSVQPIIPECWFLQDYTVFYGV